jgi:DNA-binding CsgD family transcriptional regulator/pimeloyl-ACP methyl ester carboxylesterase
LGSIVLVSGSWESDPPEQAIGFLAHGRARIAYAVTGAGPVLLLDAGRAHHLEAFWRHPPYRDLIRRLARHFTVVRWDRPGFGLSDRGPPDLAPDAELALVERLAGAVGAGELAVLAASDAAPTMIRFAARHPESVSRLALFGAAAEGSRLAPALSPMALATLATAPAPTLHEVVAAALTAGCEAGASEWLAAALEASADVGALAGVLAESGRGDVLEDARRVLAPTLVLHRENDPVVDVRWGRALAAEIPGAEFMALPGTTHPIYSGDTAALTDALVPFLAGTDGEESAGEWATLSRRELEVAEMVTLGLTNAEIGLRLSIRRRTVDAHLEHIRAKLRVTSRARIAAWVVRNGAPPGAGRPA